MGKRNHSPYLRLSGLETLRQHPQITRQVVLGFAFCVPGTFCILEKCMDDITKEDQVRELADYGPIWNVRHVGPVLITCWRHAPDGVSKEEVREFRRSEVITIAEINRREREREEAEEAANRPRKPLYPV